jgi:ABC-2 type transport system ATP-binding protein
VTAVRLSDLSKRFGTLAAVDRLSLAVPEGCVFGLLGPNGAGKTTTVRMIVGLARPDAGEIHLCGERAGFGLGGPARLIGYLPEEPAFYDWMTAPEYLRFVGGLHGLSGSDLAARSDQLLSLLGLGRKEARIRTFSRGMKQRLGIAQALVHRPKVLILDEPTSGLDPIGRKEVFDIIEGLRREMTVIMSTHILEDAERVCDRVGIIRNGQLLAEAGMEELRQRYVVRSIRLVVGTRSDGLEEALQAVPGVDGVAADGQSYVLKMANVAAAQLEVPRILQERGLPLIRFEVIEPNLEDIFVRLMKQSEADA